MLTDAAEKIQRIEEHERKIGLTSRLLDLIHPSHAGEQRRPLVSLKTLYTDFEVRELSPHYNNGNPLQLELSQERVKSDATPTQPLTSGNTAKRAREDEEGGGLSAPASKATQSHLDHEQPTYSVDRIKEALGSLISADDLQSLLSGLAAGEKKILLQSVTEKSARTLVHAAVKTCLGATHVSSAESGCVAVARANASDRREERRRSNPLRQRKFLHFTLYKENIDSNQAMRAIARHLNLSTRQMQFCGTKDKRAVTLQRVAILGMNTDKLAAVNNISFGAHSAVKVCSFCEASHGLRLGDATGNHFRIVLRRYPTADATDLNKSTFEGVAHVLGTVGAINYFGPQRFGTTDVLTSDVGVELLRGNIRCAIRLILSSRVSMVAEMKTVVELFDTEQYDEALSTAPYYCFQERDILKHLAKFPNDYLGALQVIPRTMSMMYLHAVQSLIWNRMASQRLSGADRAHVEIGDLVLKSLYDRRTTASSPTDSKGSSFAAPDFQSNEDESASPLPLLHCLTDQDNLSLFTLADVLLTVPGPDTALLYPTTQGCSRAAYDEALASLHVDFTTKTAANFASQFHFHGTYRSLVVRPGRVSIELRTVRDWRTPVITTDLERQCLAETTTPVDEVATTDAIAMPESTEDPIQALLVEFSLPPGSYATSVLREFCYPCTEAMSMPADATVVEAASGEYAAEVPP